MYRDHFYKKAFGGVSSNFLEFNFLLNSAHVKSKM